MSASGLDTLAAIQTRQSTRESVTKPMPKEALETIIDAGRHAPTAMNEQPWELVVVLHRESF